MSVTSSVIGDNPIRRKGMIKNVINPFRKLLS